MGDTCLRRAADFASLADLRMRLDPRFSAAYGLVAVRKRRKRPTIIDPRSGRSPSPGSLHTPGRLDAQVQDARDPLAQVRDPLQHSPDEPQQTTELPQCAMRLPQRALDRLAAATGHADARAVATAAVVVHRNMLRGHRLANGSEGLPQCAEAGHYHRDGWSPPWLT